MGTILRAKTAQLNHPHHQIAQGHVNGLVTLVSLRLCLAKR